MIDSDAFLGAFTMDREGQRVKIGPWHLGPGYRQQHLPDQSTILTSDYQLINQEETRTSARLKWENYYNHTAGHIPYAVCKSNGAPPLDADTPYCDALTDEENGEGDIESGGIGLDDAGSETEEPQARPLKGKGEKIYD